MYLILAVKHDPRPDSRAPPPIKELKDRFYSLSKLIIDYHAKHVPDSMANQTVDLKLLTPGGKLGPSKVAEQPVAPAATTVAHHSKISRFGNFQSGLFAVSPLFYAPISQSAKVYTRVYGTLTTFS